MGIWGVPGRTKCGTRSPGQGVTPTPLGLWQAEASGSQVWKPQEGPPWAGVDTQGWRSRPVWRGHGQSQSRVAGALVGLRGWGTLRPVPATCLSLLSHVSFPAIHLPITHPGTAVAPRASRSSCFMLGRRAPTSGAQLLPRPAGHSHPSCLIGWSTPRGWAPGERADGWASCVGRQCIMKY